MQRANQFRHNCQKLGRGSEFRFERAFRAGSGAGHQIHLKTTLLSQTENGGDGVFLRAAHDEPRNDVCDPHLEADQRELPVNSASRALTSLRSSELGMEFER